MVLNPDTSSYTNTLPHYIDFLHNDWLTWETALGLEGGTDPSDTKIYHLETKTSVQIRHEHCQEINYFRK